MPDDNKAQDSALQTAPQWYTSWRTTFQMSSHPPAHLNIPHRFVLMTGHFKHRHLASELKISQQLPMYFTTLFSVT
jgi:hypothetical protein